MTITAARGGNHAARAPPPFARIATLLLLPGSGAMPHATPHKTASYEYTCAGNCGSPAGPLVTHGGALLAGGGDSPDDTFRWFSRQAAGGDILFLRASGSFDYPKFMYDLGECNSASMIYLFDRSAADDDFVVAQIDAAHGIFFAGGDQSNYHPGWTNTRLQRAVQAAIDRGVPIGGTSAGLAIMGQFVFTAEVDGVTSAEALQDPYNRYMTLRGPFLRVPFLNDLVTDQHWRQRDRLGRTLAFMGRLVQDGMTGGDPRIRALCVDEDTSLMLDTEIGVGTVSGEGGWQGAYMLENTAVPLRVQPGEPLSYVNTTVHRITSLQKGAAFDFRNWRPLLGPSATWTVNAVDGVVSSPQGHLYGPPVSLVVKGAKL
jgi:cyanophycinase-like exopeptidase